MEKLADHIISVAQENKKNISNLQLQKIMYFVIKKAKEEKLLDMEELKALYDEPFLVWAYGPAVKSQYERFKGFGSSPIIGRFKKSPNLEKIDNVIKQYLTWTLFSLVEESHKVRFWKENKDKIVGFRSNIEYKLKDI